MPRSHPARRGPPWILTAVLVLLAAVTGCSTRNAGGRSHVAPATPNVVVILADDLGWGDLRAYNPDSRIPTPHLDRLARESLRFTDAHSPSGVCTPTRYGLMSGRYAWRTRLKSGVLWGWSPPLLEPDRLNLATLFKRHGYRTAVAGKWHLGLGWPTTTPAAFGDLPEPAADPALVDWSQRLTAGPHSAGFDWSLILPASLDMDPYVLVEDGRVQRAPDRTAPASRQRRVGGGGFWRAGPIAAGLTHEDVLPRTVEEADRFLRDRSPDERFFLYLPLTAPHTPWMPTPEFQGRSGAGWYGDFVTMVDDGVGRILAALEAAGHARNTLLVFTSDNGAHWTPADIDTFGHRANGPWRGQKSDWWEGGHRVPFLVRWPGHVRPGTSDALLCHTDLMATFADILGEPLPEDAAEDSFSFLPVLRREVPTVRTHLVSHSGNGGFAIRQDGWKLCEGLGSRGFSQPANQKPETGGPTGQLYHLPSDPSEQHNRWLEEPGRVATLTALLEDIRSGSRTRPLTRPAGFGTIPPFP